MPKFHKQTTVEAAINQAAYFDLFTNGYEEDGWNSFKHMYDWLKQVHPQANLVSFDGNEEAGYEMTMYFVDGHTETHTLGHSLDFSDCDPEFVANVNKEF